MKITFKLKESDVSALNQFLMQDAQSFEDDRKARFKILLWISAAIILTLFKYKLEYLIEIKYMWIAVGALVLLFLFFPMIQRAFNRLKARKTSYNDERLLPHGYSYELTPDGVHFETTGGFKLLYRYASINKLHHGTGVTYAFCDNGDVIIVPYDRIPENDRKEFLKILSAKTGK